MTPGAIAKLPEKEEETWKACVLGLRDYVLKNRFPGVVLGLSGGIDSAVVAAMAVDALGKDRVHCVMLPYAYTSRDSLVDAEECAMLRLHRCAPTVTTCSALNGRACMGASTKKPARRNRLLPAWHGRQQAPPRPFQDTVFYAHQRVGSPLTGAHDR